MSLSDGACSTTENDSVAIVHMEMAYTYHPELPAPHATESKQRCALTIWSCSTSTSKHESLSVEKRSVQGDKVASMPGSGGECVSV